MYNLSLTACSFHLRAMYSKGNTNIFDLNQSFEIENTQQGMTSLKTVEELFYEFAEFHKDFYVDDVKQKSFKCEVIKEGCTETDDFKMICIKILSGIYGSSSEILDGKTKKLKYEKMSTDMDVKPFYLMVVLPKDSETVTVQKGMFIFQNVGIYGVKTITTDLLGDFLRSNYEITLNCRTIAPELFVKKVLIKENLKNIVLVKNYKSTDSADNLDKGYGSEVRVIGHLNFNESAWDKIMAGIRHVSGSRTRLFEFENEFYDKVKLDVDIGGRFRRINLHNLDNLSIIEGIPDSIRMENGHADLKKYIPYVTGVIDEYLDEMVLRIS